MHHKNPNVVIRSSLVSRKRPVLITLRLCSSVHFAALSPVLFFLPSHTSLYISQASSTHVATFSAVTILKIRFVWFVSSIVLLLSSLLHWLPPTHNPHPFVFTKLFPYYNSSFRSLNSSILFSSTFFSSTIFHLTVASFGHFFQRKCFIFSLPLLISSNASSTSLLTPPHSCNDR